MQFSIFGSAFIVVDSRWAEFFSERTAELKIDMAQTQQQFEEWVYQLPSMWLPREKVLPEEDKD